VFKTLFDTWLGTPNIYYNKYFWPSSVDCLFNLNSFWINLVSQRCYVTLVTSVIPVHNAQVCYFDNVWLMFLVF